MAFKLNQSPSFKWVIRVPVQGDNCTIEEELELEIKRLTRERIAAIYDDKDSTLRQLFEVMVCGWSLKDDDGTDVPFSAENIEKFFSVVIRQTDVLAQILRAYTETRSKN